MANRATATNDDLGQISKISGPVLRKVQQKTKRPEITTKEKVLFERIDKQRKAALGEEQIETATGRFLEKILTGNSDIVDLLEFREKRKKENLKADTPVETSEERPGNIVDLDQYRSNKQNSGNNQDQILVQKLDKKLSDILINEQQISEREQVDEVKAFFEENSETEGLSAEVEAKKTVIEIKRFRDEHPDEVRSIQRENLAKKFEEETRKKNSDRVLTEKQEAAIRDEARLMADVFYGDEGIKDSDWGGETRQNRLVKLEVGGIVGLLNKKTDKIEGIQKGHKTNLGNLDGVILPLGEMPHYGVFDRLMNSLSEQRVATAFNLVRGGNWQQKIKNIATQRDSIVETNGGFIKRIGNQTAQSFVNYSSTILSGPGVDFYGGFRRILSRITTGEPMSLGDYEKVTGGQIEIPHGPNFSWLGNQLAGRVKNGLKDLGVGLGNGVKRGLASGINGAGRALSGLINATPQGRAVKTGAMAVVGLVVLVIGGVMSLSMLQMNSISGTVPPVSTDVATDEDETNPYTYDTVNIGDINQPIDVSTLKTDLKTGEYKYDTVGNIDFSYINNLLPTKNSSKRSDLIKTAVAALGVPYWMGGGHGDISYGAGSSWGDKITPPSKGQTNAGRKYKGIDCSGFVRWVYYQVTGKIVGGVASDIYGKSTKISASVLRPGDIGFRSYGSAGNHIGIYLGTGTDGKKYFIHSGGYSSHGGPQNLGGVVVSAYNFNAFGRITTQGVNLSDN